MSTAAALQTRLARADWDEHDYCGFKVFAELLGRTSLADILLLAATGRRPESHEAALVDDLAVAIAVADPRIWPLKIVRVASCYGRALPGAAAGALIFESTLVGPMPGVALAEFLVDLRDELAASVADEALVKSRVVAAMQSLDRVAGFGVPFRDHDERFVALRSIVAKRGREGLPCWRIFERLVDAMREQRGVAPNALGALTPILLDLGVPARRVPPFIYALLQPIQLANAVEGAEQAPEILRKLPDDCVEYVGPAPRLSPRAEAARASR